MSVLHCQRILPVLHNHRIPPVKLPGARGNGATTRGTVDGRNLLGPACCCVAVGRLLLSFSKKDCENYALSVAGLDLVGPEEKALVESIYRSAVDTLQPEDQKLPQASQDPSRRARDLSGHGSRVGLRCLGLISTQSSCSSLRWARLVPPARVVCIVQRFWGCSWAMPS